MAGLNSATRMGEGDAYVFNFQPALNGLNRAIDTTQLADRRRSLVAQQGLDKILAENQVGKQGLRAADVEEYMNLYKTYEAAGKAEIGEKDLIKKAQYAAIKNQTYGEMAKTTAKSKETEARLKEVASNLTNHPDRALDEFDDGKGGKKNTRQHVAGLYIKPSSQILAENGLDGSKWLYDPLNVDVPKLTEDIFKPVPVTSFRNTPGKIGEQEEYVTKTHNPLKIAIEKFKSAAVGNPKYLKYGNVVYKTDQDNALNGTDDMFKRVLQYAKDKGEDPEKIKNDPLAYVTAKLAISNPDIESKTGKSQYTDEQKRKNDLSDKESQKNWQLYLQDRAKANGIPDTEMENLFATIPEVGKLYNEGNVPIIKLDPRLGKMIVDIAKDYGLIKVKTKDPETHQINIVEREVTNGDLMLKVKPDGSSTIHRATKVLQGDGTIKSYIGEELSSPTFLGTNSKLNTDKDSRNKMRQMAKSQTPQAGKTKGKLY